MIYLTLDDLLHIAERTLGTPPEIGDVGLLEAALARPQASAFGQDAYPTVHLKAGALLHSLARNHALIDGNKRLALAALLTFYGVNGWKPTMTNQHAHDLVIQVATGELDDAGPMAAVLAKSVAAMP